ncbi:MAG: DUF2889 domain-containing protein [Betaproteobacteria bacterium]|jgi:hypothetical protein
MPLPQPVEREELHLRRIEMRAFKRGDGLLDIEGRVVDTKSHDVVRPLQTEATPAGEHLHDLSVRLVIDDRLMVHDAQASSDTTPFAVCKEASATLTGLRGATIGPGWSRVVKERLGGAASCTHLAELLIPMATTAMQALSPVLRSRPPKLNGQGVPVKVNSCYAYAGHRGVVQVLFPQHYQAMPGSGASCDHVL